MNAGSSDRRRVRAVLGGSCAGAVCAAAAVLLLPLPAAIAAVGAIIAIELTAAGVLLAAVLRRARNLRVRRDLERTAAVAADADLDVLVDDLAEERTRYHEKWAARLRHGYSASALEPLLKTARNRENPAEYRLQALETLDSWFQDEERAHQARADRSVDVLIVSHFGLPGGNTSANVADITALTRAGLRIGLLHHPVYRWDVSVPINPKIAELIDGDQVVLVDAHDTVRCDLTVVRLPTIMERLMDDLPEIDTARTVLVVNQVPFTFYDADGGRRPQWEPRAVHETVQGWLGDHTWYLIGPEVRRTLERHHRDEIDGIDIADEYWYEIIEAAEWARPARRTGDGPIRIGRHTRDAPLKWPETPEKLLACYPDAPEFAVHSLGGAATPLELLGTLPGNWVDHPFGAMPAREFLHELDVYVYFVADDCVEAFGRSPLEAMAAGVPCIMDPRFQSLFGEAAIYCEPGEVASTVRKLIDEPGAYEAQAERASRKVQADFSPDALVRRMIRLGVTPTRAGDD
ncbi:glycosyltransferase [Glycomyces rhizosphaerae]|uniref:Glycosyltransferase n=1 Tax=Glycomyces rhizosphaerae TaxID=2054422 RepID=A0ABV7PW05_9ACTN